MRNGFGAGKCQDRIWLLRAQIQGGKLASLRQSHPVSATHPSPAQEFPTTPADVPHPNTSRPLASASTLLARGVEAVEDVNVQVDRTCGAMWKYTEELLRVDRC